jgi:hypothetical protein
MNKTVLLTNGTMVLLKEIFDKYEVEQIKVTSIPKSDRGFVVVPGPQNLGHEYRC